PGRVALVCVLTWTRVVLGIEPQLAADAQGHEESEPGNQGPATGNVDRVRRPVASGLGFLKRLRLACGRGRNPRRLWRVLEVALADLNGLFSGGSARRRGAG